MTETKIDDAFKNEFMIMTTNKKPNCILFHSLALKIENGVINIINADIDPIVGRGMRPTKTSDIHGILKHEGFKQNPHGYEIKASIENLDKALKILEKYDTKFDCVTLRVQNEY